MAFIKINQETRVVYTLSLLFFLSSLTDTESQPEAWPVQNSLCFLGWPQTHTLPASWLSLLSLQFTSLILTFSRNIFT